jgi:hypothetical protein
MSYFTDELDNKERRCSHCDDSGLVYQYDKDGGVINMPCPRCTEDVMSHIRNWDWKGQMFDG